MARQRLDHRWLTVIKVSAYDLLEVPAEDFRTVDLPLETNSSA
jgi:hypothetical protein